MIVITIIYLPWWPRYVWCYAYILLKQHVIPFGSIGGILDHCFDESYIRQLVF